MKPEFSMTSDSAEPSVTSCEAHWRFAGGALSMRFATGQDAFSMGRLVDEAYAAGLVDGRKDVATAVINTAKELSA